MAEYIDRERLKEVFDRNVVSAGVFNDIIDAQPTADVIEREKIDKAIEEIEQLINHSKLPTVNIYNRYSDGLKDCLEILKRNIGE